MDSSRPSGTEKTSSVGTGSFVNSFYSKPVADGHVGSGLWVPIIPSQPLNWCLVPDERRSGWASRCARASRSGTVSTRGNATLPTWPDQRGKDCAVGLVEPGPRMGPAQHATSCRSTSSSACLEADDRPSRTSQPQSQTKMR